MNPIRPDMSKVRRLLIVKLSSIGDVVHALPVSAAIGRAFPHVELSWVVEEMAAPIVQGNSFLHEVIVVPAVVRENRKSPYSLNHFLKLRRDLSNRCFDVTLDLQGLSKSALVAWATGARYRYGYDWLRELAPLLEKRIPRRVESIHVVDQFLDVARFLGAEVDKAEFPLYISDEEMDSAKELLNREEIDYSRPFVVINPSSGGGGNKGWGAERFAALLNEVHTDCRVPVLLIGGRGDAEVANEICSAVGHPPANLVGKTSLKELAAILKLSALHLCGDTGSAHIAAALGTRVVSIFGRSNPARLAPYGQSEFALHHRDQCAAVCKRFHETAPVNSKQKCLSPPPKCLSAVTVDEVASAVRSILGLTPLLAACLLP
jgi:heptosyltransferase-1